MKEWFCANRLSLNLEKTNFIVFHTPQKNLTSVDDVLNKIVIDGVTIKQVSNSKFLGVIIDEHLTWSHHINLVANKIAKNIGVVKKIAHLLLSKTLLGLYYSMVDPFLVYGNIVWAANYQTRLNCLTLPQKRALGVITRDTYYAHTEAKFLELGTLKFININIYLIGNFVCNNLLPVLQLFPYKRACCT